MFSWFLIAVGAVVALTLAGVFFASRRQSADAYVRPSRVWPIATVALGALWGAWTFAHGAFPAYAPSPPAFVTYGAIYLFLACAAAMVGGTLRTAWLTVLLFLLAGVLSAGGPSLADAGAPQDIVSKALFACLALAFLAITALAMRRARGNWLLPLISLPAAIMYGALLVEVQLPLVELVSLVFAGALWATALKRIFWPPSDATAQSPYSVRRVIRSLAAARLPLAIAAAGAVAALALQTHRESAVRALSPHGAPITAMAFSQDGAWLAVASEDGEIRVWPTRGGRSHRIVNPDGPARQLIFDTVTVEDDGAQIRRQRLLYATAMGYVRGVDAETGAPLLADDAVPVSFGVPMLEAETPADGQALATIVAAADNAGAPVIFRLHESEASAITIAPDGPAFARLTSLTRLADPGVVAASTARGELVIIRAGSALTSVTDIPASNNIALYSLTQNIVGFVGDEVRVESRNSDAEVTWRTLEQIGTCPGDFLARFAPPRSRDGFVSFAQVVTSAGRICTAFDQGERVGYESRALAEAPTAAAFTRDGAMILGFADGSVRLADTSGAFGGRLGGHGDRVTVITLSPDGRHAATAAADGSVQFIDLAPSAAPVYAIPNAMAETADREGRRQWAAMLDRIAPRGRTAAERAGLDLLRDAGLPGPYTDDGAGCEFGASPSETQRAAVQSALAQFGASLQGQTDPAKIAASNLGAGCAAFALGGDDNVAAALQSFQVAAAIIPNGPGDVREYAQRLFANAASKASPEVFLASLRARDGSRLTDAQLTAVAAQLQLDANILRAIIRVESAGPGFSDGRPLLSFEPFLFSQATNGRFDSTHPNLSQPSNRAYLGGSQATRWARLSQAFSLDREAALRAASWGVFQFRGRDFADAGYPDVYTFSHAMSVSEANQLQAFVTYLTRKNLVAALRRQDWYTFAREYESDARAAPYAIALARAYSALPRTGAASDGYLDSLVAQSRERLTRADFEAAAGQLGCEPEALQAVAEVQSHVLGGFAADGRPVILFEPHIFSRRTNHIYDVTHPNISYRTWDASKYPRTQAERWAQLREAYELDPENAVASASYGMFQTMGFNHAAAGYSTPREFVSVLARSERDQLTAFVAFIRANNLADELVRKDWEGLTLGLDGSGQVERMGRLYREAYQRLQSTP
ncbi:N-acetylmuramidase domain-containing protein [Terricaulis sp.]|uniref:N-acetylmuramidase domain-containing protein n=1 Tax=Terricaulis sp. TaxID=2768686 RepID=UPI0037839933